MIYMYEDGERDIFVVAGGGGGGGGGGCGGCLIY